MPPDSVAMGAVGAPAHRGIAPDSKPPDVLRLTGRGAAITWRAHGRKPGARCVGFHGTAVIGAEDQVTSSSPRGPRDAVSPALRAGPHCSTAAGR